MVGVRILLPSEPRERIVIAFAAAVGGSPPNLPFKPYRGALGEEAE